MDIANETGADVFVTFVDVGYETVEHERLGFLGNHAEVERQDLRSLRVRITANLAGACIHEAQVEAVLDLRGEGGVGSRVVRVAEHFSRPLHDGGVKIVGAGRGDRHRGAGREAGGTDLDPIAETPGNHLVGIGDRGQVVHERLHCRVGFHEVALIPVVGIEPPRRVNDHARPPRAVVAGNRDVDLRHHGVQDSHWPAGCRACSATSSNKTLPHRSHRHWCGSCPSRPATIRSSRGWDPWDNRNCSSAGCGAAFGIAR